jgi:hypothetical protein
MATTDYAAGLAFRVGPLNNIQPFTYSSGMQHVELLERLRVYVNNNLRVEFNEEINRIITEFNEGLTQWDTRFTAFMQSLTALIAELNDEAIAALIVDELSDTRAALELLIDERTESYLSFVQRQVRSIDYTGSEAPLTVANNTSAAQAALDFGGKVEFLAGVFVTNGNLGIPSRTRAIAQGEDITTMRIAAGTGWDTRGFYLKPGSTRNSLEHITVDGNQANRNHDNGTGGIMGTNVSAVNATHFHFTHVKSINAMQHGFDITSAYYGNAGDGAIIPNPSEYWSVNNCSSEQSGDDAISTHGSGKGSINNFRAIGTWKKNLFNYTNSNGLEIDDYSYDITVMGGYFEGFAHGIEVKAHGNMSAGRHIKIVGATCAKNETNYSFRHIGHHVNYPGAPAVLSLTAEDVQVIGCSSLYPSRAFFGGVDQVDGDVPDDQTPAGDQYSHMVIGAYRGVHVIGFSYTSDPTFNYAGSSAIVVHFLAEDVLLDGTRGKGHTTGTWDIYATGGNQPAKNVKIVNSLIRDSAPGGISCGSLSAANILNNSVQRNVPGSENLIAIRAYGNNIIRNNDVIGDWKANYQVSNTYYDVYETPMATNHAYEIQPVFA